jgi:nucleotide-binding universal stress UspA family protein
MAAPSPTALKTNGVVGDDGELLAIGTSPQGAIARVFLGSKGTKIIRHSPVPVLVLPN